MSITAKDRAETVLQMAIGPDWEKCVCKWEVMMVLRVAIREAYRAGRDGTLPPCVCDNCETPCQGDCGCDACALAFNNRLAAIS